jgi:hypothetical protein
MSISHSPECDMGWDCTCEAGKTLYDPSYVPKDEEELFGRWVDCDHCCNPWCLAHGEHYFDCPCPEVQDVLPGGSDDRGACDASQKPVE